MAEQQTHYEFVTVTAQDLLADRRAGWEGFGTFVKVGIGGTVLTLLALLAFVV